MPCSPWSAFGEWTWYKTSNKRSTDLALSSAPNSVLTFQSDFIGSLGTNTTVFETGTVRSNFLFLMNRLDLGITQECCLCDCLTIRPFVGFAYVHTKEDIRVRGNFINNTSGFFYNADFKANTKYDGFGSRIGLEFNWDFLQCLTLYAQGGLTGLMGKFDVSNRKSVSEGGGAVADLDAVERYSFNEWKGRVISELGLGLRYCACLCNKYQMLGQVGWEHQLLFDQTNWMIRNGQFGTGANKPSANLALQGLVLRLGFGF